MAQAMKCRPSSLLGAFDPYVAFCVDRACFTLASAIEQDQQAAVNRLPKSAKETAHTRAQQRVLDEYLGIELVEQPQRFRAIGG
jgi:hypothetical protein